VLTLCSCSIGLFLVNNGSRLLLLVSRSDDKFPFFHERHNTVLAIDVLARIDLANDIAANNCFACVNYILHTAMTLSSLPVEKGVHVLALRNLLFPQRLSRCLEHLASNSSAVHGVSELKKAH